MTDPDRNTPRPPKNIPTLRPVRMGGSDRTTAPEVPSGKQPDVDFTELEGLVDEAQQQVDELKTEAGGVVEGGRPPDEPPRQLPIIGHFGPYDIVGRLALGGMAEILLAREEAHGAGSRYLVVKRILAEYERDQSFVEMFLDEARMMMRLRHPNVCHVYKFGQQDGTHFIAMEWVNGASLGKLIRRARKTGGLPIPVACRIIASVAEALDHAHQARDDNDRPLGIVHRDVTPDNLMVSYDGSVKLLDFGIAKADARSHKTQAGVVKGKFAYMAPEQCRAKELDHRVDIFALGICLFEALTGRPLYRRDTEFETMEAIVRGPIPKLADRMSNPPPELERMIARCLAKKPDDRFSSAGELQEALDRFLGSRGEVVTARRLKELMSKLFKEEMRRGPTVDTTPFGSSYHLQTSDAQALQFADEGGTGHRDLPLPDLDIDPGALAGGPDIDTGAAPSHGGPHAVGVPDDYRPGRAESAVKPWTASEPAADRPAPTAPPRVRVPPPREEEGGVLKWILLGLGVVIGVAGLAFVGMSYLMPGTDQPIEVGPAPVLTGTLVVDSEPSGATLFVDGEEIGPTPATVPRLATGTHQVRLVLDGHAEHEGQVEVRASQARRVVERLTPLGTDSATPMGRLSLTSRPRAEVYLRGQHLGQTPLSNLEMPAGVVALELVTPDGQRHRRGVMVRAEDSSSTHLDLTRAP